MDIRENIRIAVFSIRTNMLRSVLTMLGIIIGVASVISIITIGNGGRDYIVGMIEDMGSNSIQISVNASRATDSDYLTQDDVDALSRLENVKYCSPFDFSMGYAQAGKKSGYTLTLCGNENLMVINDMTVKHGRIWSADEYKQSKRVCIVSTLTAVNYFGHENCVGESMNYTVNNQTVALKIIGVVDMTQYMAGSDDRMNSSLESFGISANSSANMGLIGIPSTLNSRLRGYDSHYSSIYIDAEDDRELETTGTSALNIIKTRHSNFSDDMYVMSIMANYIDLLDSVISIFTTFIAAVSAISLLVGGIGVMNIMLVSVTERTREIGIRKALGARTSTIMLQFLTESVILCVIGGLAGLLLGVGGAWAVAAYIDIPISVKFSTIAIAIGFSSAIGIFFGIYPARRAARMTPIEALRRE